MIFLSTPLFSHWSIPLRDWVTRWIRLYAGGCKKMSSILADQQRPRMSPNAGGGVAGSLVMRKAVHRSPINFGDLTPYLTYPCMNKSRPKQESRMVFKFSRVSSDFQSK
jgi:hypothetical protein